jgi:hypothetical protein
LTVTAAERTAAARLFTEGVNFMDIVRALREINGLDKALAAEQAKQVPAAAAEASKVGGDDDEEAGLVQRQPGSREHEEVEEVETGERARLQGHRDGYEGEGDGGSAGSAARRSGGRVDTAEMRRVAAKVRELKHVKEKAVDLAATTRSGGCKSVEESPPQWKQHPTQSPAPKAKGGGFNAAEALDLPPGLSARQQALAMGYLAPSAAEVLAGQLRPTGNADDDTEDGYAYADSAEDYANDGYADGDYAGYADEDEDADDRADFRGASGSRDERGASWSLSRGSARWSGGATAADTRSDAHPSLDRKDDAGRGGGLGIVFVQPLAGNPLEVPIGPETSSSSSAAAAATLTVFELKVKVCALVGYVPARLTLTDASTNRRLKNTEVLCSGQRLRMAVDVGAAAAAPPDDVTAEGHPPGEDEGGGVTGALASRFVAPSSFRNAV